MSTSELQAASEPAAAAWEMRFSMAGHTLPAWAKRDPQHLALSSNVTGTAEVFVWDRHRCTIRQVTNRPHGTFHSAIDAGGEYVWWFNDTDGDEFGIWMRQPFGGGPDEPAVPELQPAWPAGLAIARTGHMLVGQSTADEGTAVHITANRQATTIYRHEQPAYAVDIAPDGLLAVILHSEHGDVTRPLLRVLRSDGTTLAELADFPGLSASDDLDVVGFAPDGTATLLTVQEREGRHALVLLDLDRKESRQLTPAVPGDIEAAWGRDSSGLTLLSHHRARTVLYTYDLGHAKARRVSPESGTVEAARWRPDGNIWYLWSDAEHPPRFRSTGTDLDQCALPLRGLEPPPSVPVSDVFVPGPGGDVHALISRPAVAGPLPTVFLLHGGPDDHDVDHYEPETAAWVDHGYAVVRINYRGSTGYGSAWEHAIQGRVGLTELDDVLAVRSWVVAHGIADPARLVLAGSSWGGYLALLGVGRYPDLWAVGLADAPIADYVSAYADTMEELRAVDRALFGGSPSEVPGSYRASSPITYVSDVRAPVLISAGDNDARCPRGQVDGYVTRLRERVHPHEVYFYEEGHQSARVRQRIELMRRRLDFTRVHLPY